jgi:OFA family oxalate/formate antiporter-like MFS transporter
LWGNIQTYVATYFKIYGNDSDMNVGETFYTLPIELCFMTLGLYIGNYALKHIQPRYVMLLGLSINIIFTYLASLTTNCFWFIILYGMCGGLGVGIAYMIPIYTSWYHFPDRKGLVSGIIMSGFGLGIFIFNILTTNWINPTNWSPEPYYY